MDTFYGVQYQNTTGGRIAGITGTSDVGGIISFNNPILTNTNITYDSGLFSINATGNFYIAWTVTLSTGLGTLGPSVSLQVKHNPGQQGELTKLYPCNSSMKTGQFSGSAIIQSDTALTTVGLYNTSLAEFTLAPSIVSANITILPYVSSTSSSTYGIIGTVLTLDNEATSITTIDYETAVLFNKPASLDDIYFAYNTSTGTLSLKRAGNYLFDWSINVEGSTDASSIKFAIVKGALVSDPLAISENTLSLQNTITGFAYITTNDPIDVRLMNISNSTTTGTGSTLAYSNTKIKAILRIISHN